MTNVLYKLQGRPVTALNRVASIKKTSDWVISYSAPKPKRAVMEPATAQRNGIPPSSRINYKILIWKKTTTKNNNNQVTSLHGNNFKRHLNINLPSLQSQNIALTKSQSCSCQADKDVTSQKFLNQLSFPVLEARVLLSCKSSSIEQRHQKLFHCYQVLEKAL